MDIRLRRLGMAVAVFSISTVTLIWVGANINDSTPPNLLLMLLTYSSPFGTLLGGMWVINCWKALR